MDNSKNSAHSFTEGSDLGESVQVQNPTRKLQLQIDQIHDLYTQMNDCPLKQHLAEWFNSQQPAHYGPLRAGNFESVIVSDTRTHLREDPLEIEKEIGYYGGFLVAESVPSVRLRNQIIEAYNNHFKA